MKVALVNPNRLRNPPVIPIGLEYVAHAVRQAGHEAAILDLCFADDANAAVDAFLSACRPEVAFLSIRNVDSVIRAEDQFFLDAHRDIARRITDAGIPLVVGGAGLPAMPERIAKYLGAAVAVNGPGEGAAVRILDAMAARQPLPLVNNGFDASYDAMVVPRRGVDVDYAAYYAAGGVVGFASSYGCPCDCPFCIEAGTGVRFRAIEAVVREVRGLVEAGWSRMHLCDAEMNPTLDHAVSLCRAMIGAGASWMTYMRCRPMSEELASTLRQSGCDLATVTVNSATDTPAEAVRCVQLLKAQGVSVAVDLSCGLPDETPDRARSMIAALHDAGPDRVGVTVRFRLTPTTPLAARIRADAAEQRWTTGDPEFFGPAYYCRFDPAEVQSWLAGLRNFAIDTGEAVNYQRLAKTTLP